MTTSIPTKWISATVPEIGHCADENEDAVGVASDGLRFALADGATERWESGSWARHLTSALTDSPPTPANFPTWLEGVRQTWKPRVPGPLPWYIAAEQEEASFATLIGLQFHHSPQSATWGWKVVAIGDSCLLHVRGKEFREAFPLTSPAAFGNRPCLVPSSPKSSCSAPEWLAGRAEPGDLFLLANDAVAARLLDPSVLQSVLPVLSEALHAGDCKHLRVWLRTVQTTMNDDVSLIGIRLAAQEAP